MKLVSLTKEPVAWLTFLIVAVTVLRDVLTGSLDVGTAVNSIIAALGGVTVRQLVIPLSKKTVD